MIDDHAEDTLTLYAELLALLLAVEGGRGWSHLAGAFTRKSVGSGEYVYFQYSEPGGTKRQFSVGRRTDAIDAIVEAYQRARPAHEEELAQIARLARLLSTAGLTVLPHPVARVVRALADAGVFRLGGVLAGSYAFLLLGNALGVSWPAGAWRTQDVDVAGDLQVAAPALEADVPRALESLEMGFVPVPQLDGRKPSTSFKVRGKPLRVDLLTPGADKSDEPVYIPRFRAAAAPIRFLSLIMDEAQPVPAVHADGAVLCVVPAPARFALHKLLVSRSRPSVQQAKSPKDLHQAALLLEALARDRPEDLEAATRAFVESGPVVVRRVARGLESAEARWPEAAAGVAIVRGLLDAP
jgi:hypothetical protein